MQVLGSLQLSGGFLGSPRCNLWNIVHLQPAISLTFSFLDWFQVDRKRMFQGVWHHNPHIFRFHSLPHCHRSTCPTSVWWQRDSGQDPIMWLIQCECVLCKVNLISESQPWLTSMVILRMRTWRAMPKMTRSKPDRVYQGPQEAQIF